jgi:pterin-4a-carbinolamine dehydratase
MSYKAYTPASIEAVTQLCLEYPNWVSDGARITAEFMFVDFVQAFEFMKRVAGIAVWSSLASCSKSIVF